MAPDHVVNPAPLFLLIVISTIAPIAVNMYLPAMAAMRVELDTTVSMLQLTLSAYLTATAIGQLMVGPLSDIYGRRPVLLASLVVFLVGTAISGFAQSIEVLILGRVIQGIGGAAAFALPRAVIRDLHGTATSASMIGYVTMGMAVAPLVTPAVGGLLHEFFSWRLIFLVMGLFGLVGLVAAFVRLHETHAANAKANVFKQWAVEVVTLLSMKEFWRLCLTLAAICVAFFSFVAGGGFVADEVYGLSASQYGLYFIFVVLGYIIGNFVTGRYSPKIGVVTMIKLGNVVALMGVAVALGLIVGGVGHPLALFGPMLIVGIGNGFALPNAVALCVSIRPDLAGSASGLAGAFQGGCGALTSVVVGLMIDGGLWAGTPWPVLVPTAVGAAAALALAFTINAKRFG